jgi:hypothetical protein
VIAGLAAAGLAAVGVSAALGATSFSSTPSASAGSPAGGGPPVSVGSPARAGPPVSVGSPAGDRPSAIVSSPAGGGPSSSSGSPAGAGPSVYPMGCVPDRAPLNFEAVTIGSTKSLERDFYSYTCHPNGLDTKDMSIRGSGAGAFSIDRTDCPDVTTPENTCKISVIFAPRTPGEFKAVIFIPEAGAGLPGGHGEVLLLGQGTATTAEPSPSPSTAEPSPSPSTAEPSPSSSIPPSDSSSAVP